jgi:hypothetical protein
MTTIFMPDRCLSTELPLDLDRIRRGRREGSLAPVPCEVLAEVLGAVFRMG